MTTLTWKRKKASLETKSTGTVSSFFTNNDDDEEENEEFLDDWRSLIPSNKKAMLEDSFSKSKRLQEEAVILAGKERYWEGIKKFDEALQFTPNEAKIHEMKAQALLEVGEIFPAIQAAEKAVIHSPCWAEAYQTLGRTQMGKGEIKLALKNFCKAFHLKPDLEEVFTEDISWAKELLEKQKLIQEEEDERKLNDAGVLSNSSCCKCGKDMISKGFGSVPKNHSEKG